MKEDMPDCRSGKDDEAPPGTVAIFNIDLIRFLAGFVRGD